MKEVMVTPRDTQPPYTIPNSFSGYFGTRIFVVVNITVFTQQ